MCIIIMKAEFLERNRGLSREEKDGRLFKVFWEDLAKVFNSDNEDLLEFPGSSEDAARFESLGLSCEPTGYVATADILEDKFGSMRSEYMAINAKFMLSGNGDGFAIALEQSLNVHSSKFSNYCRGQPIIEFFYFALITYALLAAAAQYMPPAAASSSSTPGSTLEMLGGGARISSAARMKQQAALTAEAVAKVIPVSSPDTKVLEKRVLENTAELTETRAKIAKVDELAALKKNLEAKELEVAAKGNSATFLEKARLAHMRNKVVDMEDKAWGFDSALAEEAGVYDSGG